MAAQVAMARRPTAPLWKLPFAELVRKTDFGNSGHSRESTDDWNKFATERLHPNAANWNCRSIGDILQIRSAAQKQALTGPNLLPCQSIAGTERPPATPDLCLTAGEPLER
jgi:hypothetical protein